MTFLGKELFIESHYFGFQLRCDFTFTKKTNCEIDTLTHFIGYFWSLLPDVKTTFKTTVFFYKSAAIT